MVPPELLVEPPQTHVLPEQDTSLEDVFEDYLLVIRLKNENDAKTRSLIRSVRRCL